MIHLTSEQRYTIEVMCQQGYKQKEIALAIGKDKSVISRELKRNSDKRNHSYKHDLAQRKYEQRKKSKPKGIRFTEEVKQDAEALLKNDYSPEQVRGVLLKEGKQCVSIERIYQHIWQDKRQGGLLYKHLRTQGKSYRKRGALKDKRGLIENRVSIDDRPDSVNNRERLGDWEADLVIGKNHKGALVTINERQTGFALVVKVSSKQAEEVSQAICKALMPYKDHVKTLTTDNGKEFANHQYIASQLNTSYYFAHPYHSWERGSNENFNGLLRQYVPKKSDLNTFSDEDIKNIQDKLNNRPRKKLNFESPTKLFNQKVALVT